MRLLFLLLVSCTWSTPVLAVDITGADLKKNKSIPIDEEPLQIMPKLPSPYSSVDILALQKEILDEVLKESQEEEEELTSTEEPVEESETTQ